MKCQFKQMINLIAPNILADIWRYFHHYTASRGNWTKYRFHLFITEQAIVPFSINSNIMLFTMVNNSQSLRTEERICLKDGKQSIKISVQTLSVNAKKMFDIMTLGVGIPSPLYRCVVLGTTLTVASVVHGFKPYR